MPFLKNRWLVAGLALDLVGLALIAWALPQGGGWLLAAGVCALLAGAYAMSRANFGIAESRPQEPKSRGSHQVEPELSAPLPRSVELKVRPKLVIGLWAIALGLLAFSFYERVWLRLPAAPSQSLLAEQGLEAFGQVHGKETRENASRELRRYLYYNFVDQDGAGVRASVAVPAGVYDSFDELDSIRVKYLPGQPSLHYLPDITREPFALRGSVIAAVLSACAIVFLDRRRRMHKRLVRSGAVAPGSVSQLQKRGANRVYVLRYSASGQNLAVRVTERNPGREDGDTVSVLYAPEKPSEAIAYPAAMYRARP